MKFPRLIGITGKARAGKDTLADHLASFDGAKYSFAYPLKAGLCAMFGWTMEQLEDRKFKEETLPWLGKSPRQMMQTIGTEWGRELVHPELWVLLAERRYQLHTGFGPFVIPDVRFDNEAHMIHSNGGIVVEVSRPSVSAVAAHKSESGIDRSLIDCFVENSGTIESFLSVAESTIFWRNARKS